MADLLTGIERKLVVDVSSQLQDHLDMALIRLQMIFAGCEFTRTVYGISVRLPDNVSEGELRKAIFHTIYREKIYAETLGMRQALVEAVTRR